MLFDCKHPASTSEPKEACLVAQLATADLVEERVDGRNSSKRVKLELAWRKECGRCEEGSASRALSRYHFNENEEERNESTARTS